MRRALGLLALIVPIPLSVISGVATFVLLDYTRTQVFLGVDPFTAIGSPLIFARISSVAAALGVILGLVALLCGSDRARGASAVVMWSVGLFLLWFTFGGW